MKYTYVCQNSKRFFLLLPCTVKIINWFIVILAHTPKNLCKLLSLSVCMYTWILGSISQLIHACLNWLRTLNFVVCFVCMFHISNRQMLRKATTKLLWKAKLSRSTWLDFILVILFCCLFLIWFAILRFASLRLSPANCYMNTK